MITEHVFLPHCWVCQERFTNQLPPGTATEARHHIVPRAFGGTDGPQVSICEKHHAKVHRIAEKLVSAKPSYSHLLEGEPEERRRKILWLATVAARAEREFGADPNKLQRVGVTLSRLQQAQLKVLKEHLGCTNNPQVFLELLDRAFRSIRGG